MDVYAYKEFLKTEIAILRTRLEPEDTGHIHTAIRVLEDRLKEITQSNG